MQNGRYYCDHFWKISTVTCAKFSFFIQYANIKGLFNWLTPEMAALGLPDLSI